MITDFGILEPSLRTKKTGLTERSITPNNVTGAGMETSYNTRLQLSHNTGGAKHSDTVGVRKRMADEINKILNYMSDIAARELKSMLYNGVNDSFSDRKASYSNE